MMRAIKFATAAAGFSLLAVAGSPALADPLDFDFNGITTHLEATGSTGRNTVKNYFDDVLQNTYGYASTYVDVYAGMASQTYTGDGHVVGPTVSHNSYTGDLAAGSYPLKSNYVVPLTLGNTDGCVSAAPGCDVNASLDTFLKNTGSTDTNDTGRDDQIQVTFHNLKITDIAFDFEIFPDGTAQQPPDFTLIINGIVVDLDPTSVQTSLYGITPGADDPYTAATDNTYTHSPNSHTSGTEASRQLLGTTGNISLSDDVIASEGCTSGDTGCTVTIQFVDWPQTVAIDNLKLNYPPPMPEPATFAIFGFGLAGLGWMRRRRKRG